MEIYDKLPFRTVFMAIGTVHVSYTPLFFIPFMQTYLLASTMVSVSNPDPNSIRSVDPDPDSESGSGSRKAKMTHKNIKMVTNFHVLKC